MRIKGFQRVTKICQIGLLASFLFSFTEATYAQHFKNAQCSFWFKGKALGTESCRTSWKNGKIHSINYLAGETPGRGNPKTVSAWQGDWIPGKNPECLVFKPTNYAICEK